MLAIIYYNLKFNAKDFIRITCTEKYESRKKSEEPQSEKVGVESKKSSVPHHISIRYDFHKGLSIKIGWAI